MKDSENSIRIFIADDHPIFRKGLRTILEETHEFEIVGESASGDKAILLIEEKNPRIAILDVDMPVTNGIEVVKYFSNKNSNTEFIFLTMYKEKDLFDEAMELGVKGYVLKDNAITDIGNCIETVLKGELYISPTVSNFIFQRSAAMKRLVKENPQIENLSPAEKTILKLIGEYKTSKEIAEEMNLSVRTIESYRANISDKLLVKGKRQLINFAIKNKSLL